MIPPCTNAAFSATEALQRLLDGNARYAAGHPAHPHLSEECRLLLSKAQHPFAAILSCADSRVPPELVFDAGLGDLFTVRVAGNIVDDAVIGSLEYAIQYLNVPLILVLGHTGCGAVKATIEGNGSAGHLSALTEPIRSALERASREPGDLLENTVRENVVEAIWRLRDAGPVLSDVLQRREARIAGAVYSLTTGRVEVCHPGSVASPGEQARA